MERPDKPDRAAAPEQREGGFAEGIEREERTPEERHIGDFAEGVEQDVEGDERRGRFSEGIETTPETPEKNLEGNFAEGVEAFPGDRHEDAAEEASIRESADKDD
jgi:hypothetical protein